MKILFIGDISGRPGREVVDTILPGIRKEYGVDFVIANAENCAGGRGLTKKTLGELQNSGIDYFTAGEHVWAYKDFVEELKVGDLPIVRPYNYENGNNLPGKGVAVIDLPDGHKIGIGCLIGQSFMRDNARSPFWAADELLEEFIKLGINPEEDPIILDFHAEATAEKVSLAHYLRNRVSAILGTHTHVATADERLIENTAFVTDVGMAGPLDASLWADFDNIIHNFKYPFKKSFKMQHEGRRIFNSVLIEVKGNKALSIQRIDKIIKN